MQAKAERIARRRTRAAAAAHDERVEEHAQQLCIELGIPIYVLYLTSIMPATYLVSTWFLQYLASSLLVSLLVCCIRVTVTWELGRSTNTSQKS